MVIGDVLNVSGDMQPLRLFVVSDLCLIFLAWGRYGEIKTFYINMVQGILQINYITFGNQTWAMGTHINVALNL